MTAESNNGTVPTRQRSRVHFAIPVFVYGSQEHGDPFQEVTDTVSVNAGGGLIGLVTPVKKGKKLLVVNLKTEESIQCSVMNVLGNKAGKPLVGFAFDQRSPRFWGLVFPPEGWDRSSQSKAPSSRKLSGILY
jgi:hypothetical protein